MLKAIGRSVLKGVGKGVLLSDSKSWSSYWTPQSLGVKVLFWGKVSEISAGQMPNKVIGATDFLTVTGSGLSAVYETPDTAAYKNADTDYAWWKTNGVRSITDGNRLIGYDLQRTPAKYLDVAPNTLEEIVILKAGETLTESELNNLFAYMHLPIMWNDSWNDYGYEKSNRPLTEQILWPVEVETMCYDTFTDTDTTSLDAHTMDVGSGWTIVNGVWTISSNKAVEATQSGTFYKVVTESNRTNFDASLELTLPVITSKFSHGLLFRYQDTSHHLWVTIGWETGATAFINIKTDATIHETVAVPHHYSTTKTLRVVASGDVIKVYYDGTLYITRNISTYNDKTKIGIWTYRAPAYPDAPRDNFIVKSPYV